MLSAIPLIPALVLAIISLCASFFVLVKISLPVLPPHPFSRRVSPSEFGLPKFRTLPVAHKCQLWFACMDLIALGFFMSQVIAENTNQTVVAAVEQDPGSSIRFALALTLRQTCMAVISTICLIQVRMGKSIQLGKLHILLWLPTFLAAGACAAFAGIFAKLQLQSLFFGLTGYIAMLTLISISSSTILVYTVTLIRRHMQLPGPEIQEKGPRPSFATEDIDALQEGSSWLTSAAGSQRDSMSQWSFSTWHSPLPSTNGSGQDFRLASSTTLAPKSSFWFSPLGASPEEIPPVPPLPVSYRVDGQVQGRPESASLRSGHRHYRPPKSSNDSWLTSNDGSQESVISAFSFSTIRPTSPTQSIVVPPQIDNMPPSSCTAVSPLPPVANSCGAKILGGYGHVGMETRNYSRDTTVSTINDSEISSLQICTWLVIILLPFVLSVLGLVIASLRNNSIAASILLVISITTSSPLLAGASMCNQSLPIPNKLFSSAQSPSHRKWNRVIAEQKTDSLDDLRMRGMSTSTYTVVEGRRSGDIWMSQGDAVRNKGKIGRALTLLQPSPPLSVLPSRSTEEPELTPPLPMQMESQPATPQSIWSMEVGRNQTVSCKNSAYSLADEHSTASVQRMFGSKHALRYSHDEVSVITGVDEQIIGTPKGSAGMKHHLRSRSVASAQSVPRDPLTPPPPFPLPPTPGEGSTKYINVRHKRSESSGISSGFSFSPVSNAHQIDALSAGMLPLLLPGVTVSPDSVMPISSRVPNAARTVAADSFSSPESHSTPIRSRPIHQRHRFSLPSLSINKDRALALWKAETTQALEQTARQSSVGNSRRATILGLTSIGNRKPESTQDDLQELGMAPRRGTRSGHTRAVSSLSTYPEGVESARSSLQTLIAELDDSIERSRSGSNATLVDTHNTRSRDRNTRKENKGKKYHLPNRRRSNIKYVKSNDDESPQVNLRHETKLSSSDAGHHTGKKMPVIEASLLREKDQDSSPNLGHDSARAGRRPAIRISSRSLIPLQLARSATAKARGVLRKTETLPQVVVRPPSSNEYDFDSYATPEGL